MKISHEAKVGLLAAVAIVIIILGVNFLKGRNILSKNINLFAKYENAGGITPSSPVTLYGTKVGQVDEVKIISDGKYKIELKFHIYDGTPVPKNSTATIESDLIGTKSLVLTPGSGALVEGGEVLTGKLQPSMLGELGDQLGPVREKVEHLTGTLDSLAGNINSIFSEKTKNDLQSSIASIKGTTAELNGFTVSLNGPMKGRLEGILAKADGIANTLKQNGPAISHAIENFSAMSDTLRALNLKQTIDQANAAIADLGAVMAKVKSGDGTVGKLLNDNKMYENLEAASRNLDKLVNDLRINPDRYVNFSLIRITRRPKN